MHVQLESNESGHVYVLTVCLIKQTPYPKQPTGYLKCQDSNAKMLPSESRSEEPCAPDITFQLTRTQSLVSGMQSSHPELVYTRLQGMTFSKLRDSSNPYRTENLARLAWDRLEKILSEARMTSVRVIIDLPADNLRQVAAYEHLQEAIVAKMPERGALTGKDCLFRRDG